MNSSIVVSAITEVLHEHECAVLPGFGAFILRKNFGIANPFSGQLKPASHSIYFNASIQEDDGFVANALKERSGYSFKQASQILIDFTKEITEVCSQKGHFLLGDLGSFHTNPAQELFFLASGTLNLSLNTYGLPHFEWKWKQQTNAVPVVQHNAIAQPIKQTVVAADAVEPIVEETSNVIVAEESINETQLTVEHNSDYTAKKRSQPLLWRAAASFAIISIGAGVLMTVAQIWSVSSGQDLASLIPQDTQVNQANKPQIASNTVEIHRVTITDSNDSAITHNIDYGTGITGIDRFQESLKALKGKYTVSGGSYITLDLAQRECLLWQKLGIDACVVSVKHSSLNKVILGRFADEERASHFAESIKNMPTGTLSVTEVALDWK